MDDPFRIVKDSSLWQTPSARQGIERKDPYLRIGIIKSVNSHSKSGELRYLVEIQDRNDSIEVNARLMRRFGGVFNYEDYIYHGYKIDDKSDQVRSFDAKAGDCVLVAFLNGEAREGIILGGISHPARTLSLDATKGPQYLSEFNGIETSINNNGEFKLTFKSIPTNIKKLDETPSKLLPKPTYDDKIGGSYLQFNKVGNIELNDVSKEGKQLIRIDKPNGKIELIADKVNLTLTKKTETTSLKTKVLNIVSDDSVSTKTKKYGIEATESTSIKTPKVAIGDNGIELLDQISKLIDALAKVTPISPTGPCTALTATPQWSGVVEVQNKIKEITGAL